MNKTKRNLIKSIPAAAAAAVATVTEWHKPVINSVTLPAHAQTSVITITRIPCRDIDRDVLKTERNIERLRVLYAECLDQSVSHSPLDSVISPAFAIPQECRDINTDIEVETEILTRLRVQLRECRGDEEPDE